MALALLLRQRRLRLRWTGPKRREQARTRAARDRLQVWPPPPGGAAAALIDPAARTRTAHGPAASAAPGTLKG
jgi:hypothetical protein